MRGFSTEVSVAPRQIKDYNLYCTCFCFALQLLFGTYCRIYISVENFRPVSELHFDAGPRPDAPTLHHQAEGVRAKRAAATRFPHLLPQGHREVRFFCKKNIGSTTKLQNSNEISVALRLMAVYSLLHTIAHLGNIGEESYNYVHFFNDNFRACGTLLIKICSGTPLEKRVIALHFHLFSTHREKRRGKKFRSLSRRLPFFNSAGRENEFFLLFPPPTTDQAFPLIRFPLYASLFPPLPLVPCSCPAIINAKNKKRAC